MDIDKRLAAELRRLRTAADISQDALGKATGLSKITVLRHENGKTKMSASDVRAYAAVLGPSMLELMGVNFTGAAESANPTEDWILRTFRALDEPARKELLGTLVLAAQQPKKK